MPGSSDRLRRGGATGVAVAALVALWFPPFFRADAAVGIGVMLPVAIALAAALVAVAPRPWSAPAAWFSVAVVGWGATLQLVDAPARVAYAHLVVGDGDPAGSIARWLLVAQALVVLLAGRPHLRGMLRWCRKRPAWAVAAGLAALVATSAVPSRDVVAYATELVLASALQLLSLACLVAAARSVPEAQWPAVSSWLDRWLGAPGHEQPRVGRWVLGLATATVAVTASLAYGAYQAHPHVPDEVVYLLHARYLAQGMLTMPLPPVPAGFDLDLMQYEPTRWFSPVPPGWPAVLSIGVRLGVPWLVNPVLAGVAVVLAWLLAGRILDRRQARLATLLLAGSPWFLFMGMNLMTHTVTLVFALAAALGIAVARERGTWGPALVAGAFVGAASLVRPLEGLITAVLLGFWSLGARGRRVALAPSVALVIGTAGVAALVAPYNAQLTGSPRVFPINRYIDTHYEPGSNDLGFGANRGLGWSGLDPFPGHGPKDVVVNTAVNASVVDSELSGWPIGAVPLLLVALLLGGRRDRRPDWWMAVSIAAVVGAHALYWFSGGPDFGARYWYLVIVPCIVLAARGLTVLDSDPAGTAQHPAFQLAGVALVLSALLLYVPARALGKYHHYRGMRPDVRVLARTDDFGRSLVLVRGARFPDYASAAVYNPIDLHADAPIYAWDATPDIRARLLDAYPDRTVWILDGPSLTGGAYRVAAGPLTPDEARATAIAPDAAGNPPVSDPIRPAPLAAQDSSGGPR